MHHKRILENKVFLIGIAVGLLADVFKLSANYLMFRLGFTKVVFWQIVATRFLEQADLSKPVALLIGAVADITVSSVLGILFVFFVYFLGWKYLYIKGIGYGLFIWVSIFGTLLGQSVQDKLPQTPSGIFVTIAAHFIFGLAMAFFTGLFFKHYIIGKKH